MLLSTRYRWPVLICFLGLILSIASAGCGPNGSGTAAASTGPNGGGRGGRGRGGRGAAQPVTVAKVSQRDVPVEIGAVGNVEASTMIAVRSQVTGVLEQVGFREGDFVKKGAVLFTVDRRPLESTLEQAQANLVRDQALVSQAEAQLARDASNAEYQSLAADRQAPLVARGIVAEDAGGQGRGQAGAPPPAGPAEPAAGGRPEGP